VAVLLIVEVEVGVHGDGVKVTVLLRVSGELRCCCGGQTQAPLEGEGASVPEVLLLLSCPAEVAVWLRERGIGVKDRLQHAVVEEFLVNGFPVLGRPQPLIQ
jgi:hypothetical protein